MSRIRAFLHCHHRWYSAVEHHDVTCDGRLLHHGAHHEHDDYARHH